MTEINKDIENLKTEIVGLKVRLARIEEYINDLPNPENYVRKEDIDDLLTDKAKEVVSEFEYVSASLLQRRLEIGYARAVRILDILESQKVVESAEDSKPRKVLIKKRG